MRDYATGGAGGSGGGCSHDSFQYWVCILGVPGRATCQRSLMSGISYAE